MPPFTVHGLGEIALRCADLDKMWAFYRDVVGLTVLRAPGDAGIGFFRLAEGHGGHTTALALFRAGAGRPDIFPTEVMQPATGAGSSLHHFALSVDASAQPRILDWLTAEGIPHRVQTFGWIGWRGIFLTDPEGNTVELVAADPSFLDPNAAWPEP